MIDIIITLDYEIFGNGTGDVIKHIIQPTNRLLEICDRYNAKLTIMFEIGEYWAFKEAESEDKLENLNYSPSELMEKQAKDAIKRGHDVQLHLHPQWIGSEYINGYWKLNFDFWRLPNLPHGLGSKDDIFSIKGALHKGKTDLEKMLRCVNDNYECIGFRAGGWCIQPEKDVISAMKDVGIKVDTSVFKGGYENSSESFFDFRNANNNWGYWWTTNDNINLVGERGENIVELPIYANFKWGISNVKLTKLLTTIRREYEQGRNPYQFQKRSDTKNKLRLVKRLFKKTPIKWDFCKLSAREMKNFLDIVIENNRRSRGSSICIPVVMIGHSKDFFNQKEFEKFLKTCDKNYPRELIRFSTLQTIVHKIEKEALTWE